MRCLQEEESEKEPAQAFEEYCDKVEETAAWGGQIELQALAQAIERHIQVHCAGLPVVEQGLEYKGKALAHYGASPKTGCSELELILVMSDQDYQRAMSRWNLHIPRGCSSRHFGFCSESHETTRCMRGCLICRQACTVTNLLLAACLHLGRALQQPQSSGKLTKAFSLTRLGIGRFDLHTLR